MNHGILTLPLKAFEMLKSSPKLILLAFLPGIVTLIATTATCIFIWDYQLAEWSMWLSVPLVVIAFPLFWLAFGNLSLIPFEDVIIDNVQRKIWDDVKLPAPAFELKKITKEIVFSVSISVFFLLLMLLSFVPPLAFLSFIIAAWITAYGFMATFYTRLNANTLSSRLKLFFGRIIQNTLLGLFLNLLLFIPLLNIWLLGYALILASLLVIEQTGAK